MSGTAHKTEGLGRASKLLRTHADFLRYVGALDGDGTWRWSDGADSHEAELRKFRQTSIVEIDHNERGGGRCDIEEYRLVDEALEYLQDHIEHRDTLCPCGHAGIQNNGDHYQCGFAPCDEQFDRSEVDA